jgi:hypothetical protein
VDLDAELLVDVVGVAAFAPSHELEPTNVVGEDTHLHHALPVPWVVEDDQVLLGEVLEDLEVIVVDVELVEESIAEVIGLGVMAVAIEPTHRGPADELILAPSDVTGGRHSTETMGGSGPQVTGIPSSHHALLTADHLRKGAVVGLVEVVVDSGAASGGEVSMILVDPSFTLRRPRVEREIPCPMPREVAFLASWRSMAGASKVI